MEKNVLVTGASRGIGKAIALALAQAGFRLFINYRSDDKGANQTKDEILDQGGFAELARFDVAMRPEAFEVIEGLLEKFGPFYGAVCNAGITADAPLPALEPQDWDRVIHTNLDGFYNTIKPLVMPMIQARQGGRIVTLSSVSGLVGNRGQTNYAASKAGIIGATKSLALELAKRKITVNCVAPGLIETDMIQGAPVDEIIRMIPMRRLGRPDEVAALVAFLFDSKAAYMTGQVISINGGLV